MPDDIYTSVVKKSNLYVFIPLSRINAIYAFANSINLDLFSSLTCLIKNCKLYNKFLTYHSSNILYFFIKMISNILTTHSKSCTLSAINII